MTDNMTDEITEKFPATSKCDINFPQQRYSLSLQKINPYVDPHEL